MQQHSLFHYFQQEITNTQQLLREFSVRHPKIAGRLRMGANNVEDPEVARLIQNFALSNAKLQYKLNDELPEISQSVLEILAPHFLAPVPSLSIARFQANKIQLLNKLSVPRGTPLQVKMPNEEICYFQTCYDTDVLPIHLHSAKLMSRPFQGPHLVNSHPEIKSVLHLTLHGNKPAHTWAGLELDSLRLHIQTPQAFPLYNLLLQHAAFIVLSDSVSDETPLLLDKDHLRPMGFEEDELLLPYASQVSMPHRLLNDYAILPEKFLFFEINGLAEKLQPKFSQPGQALHIWIYLKETSKALEQVVDASYFAMGCTPIVNLFKKSSSAIRPQVNEYEHLLSIESYQSSTSYEIYAIEDMVATRESEPPLVISPFNNISHEKDMIHYQANRVPGWQVGTYDEHGTEMLVSFIGNLEGWEIKADLLCTNRDLPSQLSSRLDHVNFQFVGNKPGAIQSIELLMPFTPTVRPFQQSGACWHYLSHLSLQPQSLSSDSEGIAAFQDILRLYTFGQNRHFQNQIEGLLAVSSRKKTARNPKGGCGNILWQGLEITLNIDETKFESNSLWLFATLLDRFLPLYCTQNAFTELVIQPKSHPEYRWPLQIGAKPLL